MTILSDGDIVDSIVNKSIEITPFKEENLTPNGYDLTIAQVVVSDKDIDVSQGQVEISPKTWFAISTEEYVRLGLKYCAGLWIRTSYARKGIISSFGMIDAGFKGTLTLSAFNGSDKPVQLEIGQTFAQLVIHPLTSIPRALYHERSGNFQDQKGVKLE
jgi:dCTP deaminase